MPSTYVAAVIIVIIVIIVAVDIIDIIVFGIYHFYGVQSTIPKKEKQARIYKNGCFYDHREEVFIVFLVQSLLHSLCSLCVIFAMADSTIIAGQLSFHTRPSILT